MQRYLLIRGWIASTDIMCFLYIEGGRLSHPAYPNPPNRLGFNVDWLHTRKLLTCFKGIMSFKVRNKNCSVKVDYL